MHINLLPGLYARLPHNGELYPCDKIEHSNNHLIETASSGRSILIYQRLTTGCVLECSVETVSGSSSTVSALLDQPVSFRAEPIYASRRVGSFSLPATRKTYFCCVNVGLA